ncbi:MAG: ABC transporter ATP-binding protein [Verrucomicrobia bacterium]|nr:ABC transporter ATP-binding protein [Verrucomicrobiota bacterium]
MAKISVEQLSLTYPVYGANSRSIKTALLHAATGGRINTGQTKILVEALKEVNFCLETGDRLALIGHNGAGKSTLLKVLAQIYEPSSGRVFVEGRSNCLFDIMMGMELELNAYENIRIRGLILGLSKEEIARITPDIEAFAELGDFMRVPIKAYSAGMKVRLAFAIITSIRSEILLIDEIVSVGDASFMQKAKERMRSLVHQADILVLSTHDHSVIREFCNKALWLEHGQIKQFGPVESVLSSYR